MSQYSEIEVGIFSHHCVRISVGQEKPNLFKREKDTVNILN